MTEDVRADAPGFLMPGAADMRERGSWLPWAVAAGVIVVTLAVLVAVMGHSGARNAGLNLATAPPDPYAANLPISHLQMSEAGSFAGGKVTYVDGQIANTGTKTVDSVTVAVTFRNDVGEPPQQVAMPLSLIRTRDPYVDIEPVSADPLKPGEQKDFRLIFDHITPNWNGQYPSIKVVRVHTRP